jgi:DNA repair photolyase
MSVQPIHWQHKGRGAVSNPPGRFERESREFSADGWEVPGAVAEPEFVSTQVLPETVRSLISRNDSPDIHFTYSINPYRGCEHGCIYCYARPYHAYLGLSPGLDFETRLFAKVNAVDVLKTELLHKKHDPQPLHIGSVTDPYQPCEKQWQITRGVLQTLHDCGHACTLITKGSLVLRDLDLLQTMAARQLVAVEITLVTLDPTMARSLEPRAASPAKRLQIIEALSRAGVPVGVSVAPIIPFVNDDFEQVLKAAREAGASRAHYVVLRLPWELKQVFTDWLELNFPDRAGRVLGRISDLRGMGLKGERLNDPNFFTRMKGEGIWADLIRQRFVKAVQRLGFTQDRFGLRTDLFDPKPLRRAVDPQGSLF